MNPTGGAGPAAAPKGNSTTCINTAFVAPISGRPFLSAVEVVSMSPLFTMSQVDVALEGTDPHAVGLAKRTVIGATGGKGGDGEGRMRSELRRASQGGSKAGGKKGFATGQQS